MDAVIKKNGWLLEYLREHERGCAWEFSLVGPAHPAVLTAYLCLNNVSYSTVAKEVATATAVYDIWVICPDANRETLLEALTLRIKDILLNDHELHERFTETKVSELMFAPPAGKTYAGAAHIKFTCSFEDYEY